MEGKGKNNNGACLEYSVRQAGGTYAMEDTDSMAIVASSLRALDPVAVHAPCYTSAIIDPLVGPAWAKATKARMN